MGEEPGASTAGRFLVCLPGARTANVSAGNGSSEAGEGVGAVECTGKAGGGISISSWRGEETGAACLRDDDEGNIGGGQNVVWPGED